MFFFFPQYHQITILQHLLRSFNPFDPGFFPRFQGLDPDRSPGFFRHHQLGAWMGSWLLPAQSLRLGWWKLPHEIYDFPVDGEVYGKLWYIISYGDLWWWSPIDFPVGLRPGEVHWEALVHSTAAPWCVSLFWAERKDGTMGKTPRAKNLHTQFSVSFLG